VLAWGIIEELENLKAAYHAEEKKQELKDVKSTNFTAIVVRLLRLSFDRQHSELPLISLSFVVWWSMI